MDDTPTTPIPRDDHRPDAPAGPRLSDADRQLADRRAFLKAVGTKAIYAAPAVVTLAAASRANAASSTSPSA